MHRSTLPFAAFAALVAFAALALAAGAKAEAPIPVQWLPKDPACPQAAKLPADFQPYLETIPGTKLQFKMVPIPGGKFRMGSPDGEADRLENEGPATEVEVGPFWVSECEITWQIYEVFAFKYDIKAAAEAKAKGAPLPRTPADDKADAVTRPTPPYVDMTFGYGHDNFPAICMTPHAARTFGRWLAAKTARGYRLPTEAEWEFAARAGTTTPYYFGSDPAAMGEHGWFAGNANDKPHPVKQKKPNPYGLYDIHGNVQEWCEDHYFEDYFAQVAAGKQSNPLFTDPRGKKWPFGVVRGGSWQDEPPLMRVACRTNETADWKIQDPQQPQSIWWLTDAHFVGIRLCRPYRPEAAAPGAGPAIAR